MSFHNIIVFNTGRNLEIARLQNSLQHLKDTQKQLEEFLAEASDKDLEDALRDNQDVMCVHSASQPWDVPANYFPVHPKKSEY